jgi:hypothetical protein
MLKADVFNTLSKPQSRAVLKALAHIRVLEISSVFFCLPESLGYCVSCEDFADEVKFIYGWGMVMCRDCVESRGMDWDKPDEPEEINNYVGYLNRYIERYDYDYDEEDEDDDYYTPEPEFIQEYMDKIYLAENPDWDKDDDEDEDEEELE